MPTSASNDVVTSTGGLFGVRAINQGVWGTLSPDRVAVTNASGHLTTSANLTFASNVLTLSGVLQTASSTTPQIKLYGSNPTGLRISAWISDSTGLASLYAYDDDDGISPDYADLQLGGQPGQPLLYLDASTRRTGVNLDAPDSLFHIKETTAATNSSAGFTIDQAGTGDAAMRFTLSGLRSYALGIDNSDSDHFKLTTTGTLGTGAVMQLDPSNSWFRLGARDVEPATDLHLTSGNSGVSDPGSNVDFLIETANSVAAVRLASLDASLQSLYFSRPSSKNAGWLQYDHSDDTLNARAGNATVWEANAAGDLTVTRNVVSEGWMTTSPTDWNFDPSTTERARLVTAITNAPTASRYGGVWIPMDTESGDYGFVLAERDEALYLRSRSSGAWNSWREVWHAGSSSIPIANTDAKVTSVVAGTGIGVDQPTGQVTVSLSHLGLQSLTDPGADRILFWDDSLGGLKWLTLGANLVITGDTIDAAGGGGDYSAGTGLDLTGTTFSLEHLGLESLTDPATTDRIFFYDQTGGAANWLSPNEHLTIAGTNLNVVDGAGSGLDGDLLDGQEGSYYLDLGNATGILGGFTANKVAIMNASGQLTTGNVDWNDSTSVLTVNGLAYVKQSTGIPRLFVENTAAANTANTAGIEARAQTSVSDRLVFRISGNFQDTADASRTGRMFWTMPVSGTEKTVFAVDGDSIVFGKSSPSSNFHFYSDDARTDATAGLTVEQDGAGDAVVQWVRTGAARVVSGIDATDGRFKIAASAGLATDTFFDVDLSTKYLRVGGGALSPEAPLHVATGDSTVSTPGDNVHALIETNGSAAAMRFASLNASTQSVYFSRPSSKNAGWVRYDHNTDDFEVRVGGATAFQLDVNQDAYFQGQLNAVDGLSTERTTDWDTLPTDAVLKLYNGATNNPTLDGTTNHFGLFVPSVSDTDYGFQIAARNNLLYYRAREGGSWGAWLKLWHQGNDGSGSGLDADAVDGFDSAYLLSTSNHIEGTNLFFTDARARSAISGTPGEISYNSGTGVIGIDGLYPGQTSIDTLGTVTTGTWQGATISTTYTDAKVTSVSGGVGISVSGGTGAASVSLSHLGLQALADPGSDRIFFWDESANAAKWLAIGSGLQLSGTTLSSTDTLYTAGTGLQLSSNEFSLSHLGLEQLTSPASTDRILFYDQTTGGLEWLSAGANITISGTQISATDTNTTYSAGTGLQLTSTTFSLSHLGLQNLADPNADRIAFWDDSSSSFQWLTVGSNLNISGSTLSAVDTNTTYSAGDGISFSGTTVNNVDKGSDQFIFKRIGDSVGGLKFSAASNNDMLRFASGGGTSIAFDSGTNKITITSTDTNTTYSAGTGISFSGTVVNLNHLGIENLSDPGADRIGFWDDSAGSFEWLTVGTGLQISGTTLSATGGGGGGDVTGLTFSDSTGVLSLTQNNGTSPVTVDLDGRYGAAFSVTEPITGTCNLSLDDNDGSPLDLVSFTGAGNIQVNNIGGPSDIRIDDTQVSDRRLKTNFVLVDDAWEIVDRLKVHRYRWKNSKSPKFDDKEHVGWVAQEVREAYPVAYQEREDGYGGVDQRELVPVLWKAFQEAQARIEWLEKTVRRLVDRGGFSG